MTKNRTIRVLVLSILLGLTGCAKEPPAAPAAPAAPAPTVETEPVSESELIRDMVLYYGRCGDEDGPENARLLARLRSADPDAADRWERILSLWKSVNEELEVHPELLPEGLCDTDELCLVVLGFQLNPDGSMREELIERLNVALSCAEQYPHAMIVCTGGGTAAQNKDATEAGEMAKYLIGHGVAAQRILVEDRSLTTAQNAVYTCALLAEKSPQVHQLAIISSDYHIATGVLLFDAQAILTAEEPGKERFTVVSNAAYPAPTGSLSPSFQAGALIELSGDVETAFDVYYGTYDVHELPTPGSAS